MFGWWTKIAEAAASSPAGVGAEAGRAERPPAAEVETEYSEYLSRIRQLMVLGAIVGIAIVVLLRVFVWMQGVSNQSVPEYLRPDTPPIVFAPMPATFTAAGLSLLAAIAIALQLAVRTPSEAESRPASALARRRFLCGVARVVVLASNALAVYATIPALLDFPNTIDIVRLFGPVLGGTLVALIAADAGVAADPDYAPAEMGRVWRARVARRLLIGVRLVGSGAVAKPVRTYAWQGIALIGTPLLVSIASFWSAPGLRFGARLLLMIVALITGAIVYAIAVHVYIAAVAHDWVGVSSIVLITLLVGALCWLMVLVVALTVTAESQSLAPTFLAGAWAIAHIAVPAFIAAWLLTPFRDLRPRVLGLIVRGVLVKRLERRHKGIETTTRPAFNKLAAVSPWVSLLLPFGMFLAIVAKQQIHRASVSPGGEPQRGEWAANLAIGLTIFLFIALIGGLIFVAFTDPAGWNDLIWE